jgi:transcriptional regulator with XRE-family HTH domain
MRGSQERRSAVFARKVRQLRTERGWSQAELGRRVGLGQSRTAMIEQTGSVNLDQADAFAVAFGVPVEVLLYADPPATKAVQVQQLMQILGAVDRARDEVGALVDEITAGIPGPLGPPGMTTVVTADRIETFPPLPESE